MPALGVTNSTVAPVSIAVDGSAAAPPIEAYNAGDGNLTLATPQVLVPWLTATVGAATACKTATLASRRFPSQLQPNVAGLAASSTAYAGAVTAMAPNTVDASQNPWLSLALQGTGRFRFVLAYDVQMAPQASQTPGTYNGTIVTSSPAARFGAIAKPLTDVRGSDRSRAQRAPREGVVSCKSADNKTNVTMNVTSQPIAQASSSQVNVTLPQGAAPLTYPCTPLLAAGNAGIAALSLQAPVVTAGSRLTATGYSAGAMLSFNPSGLAANYLANATMASNGTVACPT